MLARDIETAGANAVHGHMIFGSIPYKGVLRSRKLFTAEVMPAQQKQTAA